MSIVDAISKAKRSAQQNRVPTPVVADAVGPRDVPPQPILESPAAKPLKPMSVPLLDIDILSCSRNKVLLPGAEASTDGKVETAFRMLRTRVLQRSRANNWTTIGITSASPSDGKTLTSLNLALSLAKEKNSEIVLLDLDMRNPSVCERLGVNPPNHMREFFEGLVSAEDLFFSIGVEHLMLAGGAQPSNNSSELLSNTKFEELIDQIKSSLVRPLVIIDLPPVLSTDDALVLAPRLDAIFLIASEGQTTRDELNRAAGLLSEYSLAGFVLNRSQQAVKGYGYY